MAIKFDLVKVGDVLYDCHMQRMGNTTMRQMGTWRVVITEKREYGVMASWNWNPPSYFPARIVERWRRSPRKKVAE